jgi:hypothetical protein
MDEKRKLQMILGFLLWFLIYMIVIGTLFLFCLITGNWSKWLDLALYIGNVVAFGLSFYILANAKKVKFPFMRLLGVFIMIANGWGIIKFYL